jgi:hypothetical protein
MEEFALITIREVENYSLILKGDCYYIDNGEDVSEYMDIYDAQEYICLDDKQFIQFCSELFNY